MAPRSRDEPSDDEWRFSVDDVSDDDEDDAPENDGSVFGPRPDDGAPEVLPGDPDPTNVLFVVLGVVATLLVVFDLVGLV